MDFYEVDIPLEHQPTLVLSAEVDELGITAGLQDRVAQVYQGLVYMDFSENFMRDFGHGVYESLDPTLLPRLFVAYQPYPTKVSGRVLNDLRSRWERGDPEVLEALDRIAELATRGRDALQQGTHEIFASLMNENFDLRRRIMRISELDLTMVEAARRLGASAKLTGSGGAVIGMYGDDDMKQQIARQLGALGAHVIEPVIV
jgi:glucuronokinase